MSAHIAAMSKPDISQWNALPIGTYISFTRESEEDAPSFFALKIDGDTYGEGQFGLLGPDDWPALHESAVTVEVLHIPGSAYA